MSNLFAALSASSGALRVFQQALTVAQNNVANASTPGYAKQIQTLESLPFDARGSLAGGVAAGPVASARNTFAEAAVQRHASAFGEWSQQVDTLDPLQEVFDVTSQSGISGALNALFTSFSRWADSPGDRTARDGVIDAARTTAAAFQSTGAALTAAAAAGDRQVESIVARVNELAAELRDANRARARASGPDPGLDARVYAAVEELSELAPFSVSQQANGTFSVLLNGQTPLVIGDDGLDLRTEISAEGARVFDSQGNDLTERVGGGRLGGLLTARNRVIPALSGDVDRLARSMADHINGVLTSGLRSDGPPPVAGSPLFAYDPNSPGGVSRSLTVSQDVTADQLGAIDPGPPRVVNGIPLRLAELANPSDPDALLDGLSYPSYFGKIAGTLGTVVASAQTKAGLERDLGIQAKDLRQQSSGVSLDEEAVKVLEFQRSYQAASKMVTVLDGLLETLIQMAPR